MSPRLTLALNGGGLALPESGTIAVFHPRGDADLTNLPTERAVLIQPLRPDHDALSALGYHCVTDTDAATGRFAASLIYLPRSKAQARGLIAAAATLTDGFLMIDGQKTDGIDSLMREVKKRAPLIGSLSKAHGKMCWLAADSSDWSDWAVETSQVDDIFSTVPGVFSADGIDPASKMLADHLPEKLGKCVADLGAGWGYLSARVLERENVRQIQLVEADNTALSCARANIADARAHFHWEDATTWQSPDRFDAIVMNPPFHIERRANPALGRAFVVAAARLL
ncbi:MAG: methyltransferase, partial [Paracoccaceae bacterium]